MAQLAARRDRAWVIRIILVVLSTGGLFTVGLSPAGAEVTSATGSAYGFWAELSLFGGPPSERGPEPAVELAPDASDSPQEATVEEAAAVFGPATVFRSKEIVVRAEATLGPGGSVTTSSRVQADLDAEVGDAQRRPGPMYYDALESTCTAEDGGDITATTVVEGGVVVTSYDPSTQEPRTEEEVPENPEPGYTVEGTIDHVSDRFRIVYNEQIENPDGSITVNAAHMYFLGDIAVGDLIIGQSTCGVETSGPASGGTDSGAAASEDPVDEEAFDEPPSDDADDDAAAPGDGDAGDDGVPVSALGLGLGAVGVIAVLVALVLRRRGGSSENPGAGRDTP